MIVRRGLVALASTVMTLSLVGCSGSESPEQAPTPDTSSSASSSPSPTDPGPVDLEVTGTIAEGLNVPWSIVFLPSGDALVSQRDDATVVRVTPDGDVVDVGPVPGEQVRTGGEGGLLGLAIDPDDETSLYAYLSTPVDNRVVQMTYEDDTLSDPRVVLDGIPLGPRNHQGGRLLFDDDGSLFVSTGDAGSADRAQDRGSLSGKILRVDRDGEPVEGNPFDDRVYSYGHRNVQGLAFDEQGRLWASEFGDQETDELNLIEPGANYGWPVVEGDSDDPDLVAPQVTWSTDEASPAGIAIVRDTVVMGALRGERIWSVDLDETDAPQDLAAGEYGRIRDVAAAPDGSLWISTSNTDGRGDLRDGDDRILRVTA